MKLRNKLMPLMAFATTSMVVAPIATSCGNSATAEGSLDITSPYTPTIAKAEKTGSEENPVDITKATDIYMKDVIANPDIIKQDIWYYEAKKLPERIAMIEHTYIDLSGRAKYDETESYNAVTDVTATVNVSDVEVNRQEAIIKGVKTEFYTISMNLGYEFKFTATSFSTEPRIQLTKSASFQSTYKNIPLYLYKSAGNWFVSVDLMSKEIDEYLQQLPNWSLDCAFSTDYDCAITTHGLTQHFTDSRSINDHIVRRSQVRGIAQREQQYQQYNQGQYCTLLGAVSDMYLNFVSYHMLDVATPTDMVSLVVPKDNIYAQYCDDDDWTIDDEDTQKINILKSTDEAKKLTAKAGSVRIDVWNDEDGVYSDNGFSFGQYDYSNKGTLNFDHDELTVDYVNFVEVAANNWNIKQNDNELAFNLFNLYTDDQLGGREYCTFTIPAGVRYKISWMTGDVDSDSFYEEELVVPSDFTFKIYKKN